MVTRQQVTTVARRYNARVEYRADKVGLEHELVIDAPVNYVWTSSLVHQLVMCGADGTSWQELYQDALERMAQGIEKCMDINCDICNE